MKEGNPKFNPRPGRGLNSGPSGSWSEILPTVPTLHTQRDGYIGGSSSGPGGRGVLPYIGYTGMCRWRGYGFQVIWSGIGSSNHRKLV